VTFTDFLGRNAIVVGFLLLVAGGGVVLGLTAGARERSVARGTAALLCALVCVGVGVAQRSALLDASVFAAQVPGLSHADRERIVAYKLADAGYALEVALASALLPVLAGAAAIARAMRARRA
jgi:hypothetical protein